MAGLNAALQGKTYPTRSFDVTAEGINRYARAINEDNPAFNSSRALAPPAYPFVIATPPLTEVMLDPELGVDMAMLVHAEQDHRLLQPIVAGDSLQVHTTLEQVDLADTGHTFTVGVILEKDGRPAAEVRSKMFIRKTGTVKAPKVPEGPEPQYLFEVSQHVDADQAERYAQASGDHNPIHLDKQAARRSGFPGVVLHGMCTMAFACKVLLDQLAGGDPVRMRRVKVQFSRPVFPGQAIATRAWGLEEGATYGFETINSRGSAVITQGVAEIDPAD